MESTSRTSKRKRQENKSNEEADASSNSTRRSTRRNNNSNAGNSGNNSNNVADSTPVQQPKKSKRTKYTDAKTDIATTTGDNSKHNSNSKNGDSNNNNRTDTQTSHTGDNMSKEDTKDASQPKKKHVLIGVSGSVATIKLKELVTEISKFAEVQVVTTNAACHFFDKDQLSRDLHVTTHTDAEEWSMWNKRDDPVLHIELRKWADVMVIAPLSANTLAKIANGMSDNLLTCVVRAWDYQRAPLLVAPSMNTLMWSNPFTSRHLAELKVLGIKTIDPVAKKLMCGDIGLGAMAEVKTIVEEVREAVKSMG